VAEGLARRSALHTRDLRVVAAGAVGLALHACDKRVVAEIHLPIEVAPDARQSHTGAHVIGVSTNRQGAAFTEVRQRCVEAQPRRRIYVANHCSVEAPRPVQCIVDDVRAHRDQDHVFTWVPSPHAHRLQLSSRHRLSEHSTQ